MYSDNPRSSWIGSTEIQFANWIPGTQLYSTLPDHLQQKNQSIIGFRVYTKCTPDLGPIGHMYSKTNLLSLADDEEEDMARQEYFYNEDQLKKESSNILFATASSGDFNVVIRTSDIASFIECHKSCIFVCLNAAVDFLLLKSFFSSIGNESAVDTWLSIADEIRLRDVYVLDGLVRLGLEDGRTLNRPFNEICLEYLTGTVYDITTHSYSASIGNSMLCPRRLSPSVTSLYSATTIFPHDDTIAASAINDVVLIQSVYLRLLSIALLISNQHKNEMFEVATELYGPLSEGIQVKGSIVLYDITKNGIAIDRSLVGRVQKKLEERLNSAIEKLMEQEKTRGLFQLVVGKDGNLEPMREGIYSLQSPISSQNDMNNGNYSQNIHNRDYHDQNHQNHQNGQNGQTFGMESLSIKTNDGFSKMESINNQLGHIAVGTRPKIDQSRLDELLAETAQEIVSQYNIDVIIPRIPGGMYSRAPKTWAEYSQFSDFLKTWIDMEQAGHFNTFLSHLKEDRAHPQYAIMVRNGRTSAQNPPIQQTPRKGGFREIFGAKKGHVLVAIDYDFIELCTLAAVCLARYGNSVLAQVICQGIDPHAFTASMIEGVSLHTFMSWKTSNDPELKKKFATLRQRAKAVNFGIPSGLTAAGLGLYAKSAYGVELSTEESEKFRKTLIYDIYPELSKYLEESDMQRLATNLNVPLRTCWNAFTYSKGKGNSRADGQAQNGKNEAIEGGMRNIVRGKRFRKRDGKEYNPYFVKKVWGGLKRITRDPQLFKMLDTASKDPQGGGSEEIYKELFGRPVVTLTGRVRGKVGFTQACNTPFSGLAADGAKLAMWNLYQLGYTVVGFIHDEILLEIPETESGTYDKEAESIKEIMIGSMKELTGPIPVGCQLSVSYVWSKDAHAVYNSEGKLVPWIPKEDPLA